MLGKTVFQLSFQMLLQSICPTKLFPGHFIRSCTNGLPGQVRQALPMHRGFVRSPSHTQTYLWRLSFLCYLPVEIEDEAENDKK